MAPASIGAMPGMAMLVLRVTFPASTGCLVVAAANSKTKLFLPCFHCPDSLSSVTAMSFTLCVLITFIYKQQHIDTFLMRAS